MLGGKRVSGGAALSESGDGGHDGGNSLAAAEQFGSLVVGRPFPDCGRSGAHGGHRRQRPGSASWRVEARALAWNDEAGRGRRFWTLARMMFNVFDHWDRSWF